MSEAKDKPVIEKDFKYRGYRCIVVAMPKGHRCGYIQIDDPYMRNKQKYEDIDVHGGVTWIGYMEFLDSWVVGFDCIHPGDAVDYSIMSDKYKKEYDYYPSFLDGTVKDTDFCINECKHMVEQIKKLST